LRFSPLQTAAILPDRKDEVRSRALEILAILERDYKHPVAGFEEANPPRAPLCSNPHMHLFEAMLAWEKQDHDGPWSALADEIAGPALSCFIDGGNGGLREFFAHDWTPYEGKKGRIMEPGHQFEWGSLRGNDEAIRKAKRLFELGEEHGICPRRKVALMSLYDDFSVRDGLARLWPQTEWLRAAVRFSSVTDGEERQRYLASGLSAIGALQPFLDRPVKDLWFDKWPADRPMLDEPAPASTFYHIVRAIYEAEAVLATAN